MIPAIFRCGNFKPNSLIVANVKPETPDLGVHEVLVEGHEVLDERSLKRTYVNDKPVHVKEVLIRRELRHGARELVTDKLHVRGYSDPA